MDSFAPECKDLKVQYEACFNNWYVFMFATSVSEVWLVCTLLSVATLCQLDALGDLLLIVTGTRRSFSLA